VVLLFALLIGVVAGMRAMTAPAAVSWAAYLGLVKVAGTPLAFMAAHITPYIFTLAAIGELVNDKLPKTPSRKVPPQFITRLVTGGLAGATLGIGSGQLVLGIVAGLAGAVIGTYGGSSLRSRLSEITGNTLVAALIEDSIAIILAIIAVRF
jgi:uncharacterized membrane protein